MRLIVFADVRAQPDALDALFQVAARQPPADLVCLGGAVPGPDPQGTLERLRKKGALLVAGAAERAFVKSDALGAVKPAEVAYLRAASPPRRLVIAGRRFLLTADRSDASDGAITPATCGALGAEGEAPYLVIEEDGSLVHRTLAWTLTTRHV